jgi:ankyrin repeat protein
MFLQKSKSRKEVIGDEELGQLLISMQINCEKDYNCEKIGPKRQAKMHDFSGNERRVKNRNNARDNVVIQRLLLHSESQREIFSTFEDLINNLKVRKTPNKIVYESLEHFLNKSHSKNLGITIVYNGLKSIPRVNLPSSDFKKLFEQYYKRKDITISGEDFLLIYNKYEKDEYNESKNKFINEFSEGIDELNGYISRNNVSNVKTFLKSFRYSINYFDIPVLVPELNKDISKYEYIISKKYKKENPLMKAVGMNHPEIVQVLLQHEEINVNVQDEKGDTALIWAAEKGRTEVVKRLLKHPLIDVNVQDNIGQTALMLSVYKRKKIPILEIVKELLKRKEIDVNLQNRNGNTALILTNYASNTYHREQVVEELLEHDEIDVNVQNKDGDTALMVATKERNWGVLSQIVYRYKKISKE